jgi:hypothetical protein
VNALREARAEGWVRAEPGQVIGQDKVAKSGEVSSADPAADEPVTTDVVRTVEFRLFPEGRRPAGSSSPSALVR